MILLDWLRLEGWVLLSWWLWTTLAALAVMPLCLRIFGRLPDYGYSLSRTVGLLLVGFVFWLLATLGFVRNTAGSIVLAWAIVGVAGWLSYSRLMGERIALVQVWRNNKSVILTGELLFAALLVGWALFRALYPNLTGTEKPMELAFISAIMRSETFPPNDPWMAGYAISYYHFGYVMAAALGKLSGINSAVTFNMMISLIVALTGFTSFGVVANIVRAQHPTHPENPTAKRPRAVLAGLLGMLLVVFVGNFQLPLIELPYQLGINNAAYYRFWDVQERTTPPNTLTPDWDAPDRWDFWWWFRASRVINDRNLPTLRDGQQVADPVGANVIDEFPQFSFVLADVHPHVLALPFALMMLGLALNIVLQRRAPNMPEVGFYGLAVGGMMFLNMWDGPIYLVVLVGAEGLRRMMRNGGTHLSREDGLMLALFGVSLIGLAYLFYLPFFMGFRSQAAGIIPNVQFPTLFRQFFVMFAPFILLLVPYVIMQARAPRANGRAGLRVAIGLWVALSALTIMLVLAVLLVGSLRAEAARVLGVSGSLADALPAILGKRLTHSVTLLVLLSGIGVAAARLLAKPTPTPDAPPPYDARVGFTLLVLACGAGLTLVPEFVYLRDNFGVRINTIFKFYYQAWVMFAVVSAVAVHHMLTTLPRVPQMLYSALVLVVLSLGMMYPVLAIHNRAFIESGRGNFAQGSALTLDGTRSLVSTDDYLAIQCLSERVQGDDAVIAEAIGGAYRHQYGRVAVISGLPNVLGWENHQRQWRGATYPQIAGTRRTDIELLYNDPRWEVAADVIRRYDIDYIFYGTTERIGTGEQAAYQANGEAKFEENLTAVCQFGDSLFYQVTPNSLQLAME